MIRTYPFLGIFPEVVTVSTTIQQGRVREVYDNKYNTPQKRLAEITPVYSELVSRFGREFVEAVLPGCTEIYNHVHRRYMTENFLPTHGIGFDKFAACTGLEPEVVEAIKAESLKAAGSMGVKL